MLRLEVYDNDSRRLENMSLYDKNANQRSPKNVIFLLVGVRKGAVTCKICQYLEGVHSFVVILAFR